MVFGSCGGMGSFLEKKTGGGRGNKGRRWLKAAVWRNMLEARALMDLGISLCGLFRRDHSFQRKLQFEHEKQNALDEFLC